MNIQLFSKNALVGGATQELGQELPLNWQNVELMLR